MKAAIDHPSASALALLAGGELAWKDAMRTHWHMLFCHSCAHDFAQFRSARAELRQDLSPAGLDRDPEIEPVAADNAWKRLEAEMRANIRLGLTAGSLAEARAETSAGLAVFRASPPWRWAAVGAALVFVLVAGWSLRTPLSTPAASASLQNATFAEPAGPDVRMQLLVPVADVSRTETDFDGSTRSRVIDRETGQVTLQQVYVE